MITEVTKQPDLQRLEWSTSKQQRNEDPSPRAILRSTIAHSGLIKSFAQREVVGRYRGSALGILWSFFTPALMLMVYTFFFGVIFRARWPKMGESTGEFALILFAGLLMFNLFSETVNKAPTIIVSNTNLVKRVIFPLEIFAQVNVLSALFHFFISLLVWLFFYLILIGLPPITIVWLPIAILPLCFLLLGLTWLLSSLGVYLRDVSQVVTPVTAAMMFLSPIFYPLEMLSGPMRRIVELSPLTFAVETARAILMWGEPIAWLAWSIHLTMAMMITALGFAWFQKTRKGFADVL
ncbi:MAG: ABC transporter permease [Lamprobacter sp.]|uniref:ABC transporter permease n=1 Tax=Lamprobacter sp. TaxID=3100796 RepID=UPI002B2633B4|nr:ABC transporter permease [Lamprobacter sp.]MEA3638322.1 ABC transporter permease [Lamprobacter sp.]